MAKATHASGPTFSDDESTTPVEFRRPELGRVDSNLAFDEDPANAKNSSPYHAGDTDTVVTGEDSVQQREEEESTSADNPEDGTDSSPSSKSEQSSGESNTAGHHKLAQTTESHSKARGTEADSSVSSTDTDGLNKPQTPSSRRRGTKKPSSVDESQQANVRSTDGDADDFDF